MLVTLIVWIWLLIFLIFFFLFMIKENRQRRNFFFLCSVKCYIFIQLNLLKACNKEVRRCRIMLVFRVEGSPLQPFSRCFLEVFRLMLFHLSACWSTGTLTSRYFLYFQVGSRDVMANWILRNFWCAGQ